MKSLLNLWNVLAEELANWCGICIDRDIKTVAARSRHEGMSFLTITLADFARDLHVGLESELVSPSLFCSFKKRGRLPLFLGGFLELVFDRETGVLLPQPSHDAIYALRQLTMLFAKVKMETTPKRTRRAYEKYVAVERELTEMVWSDVDFVDYDRFSAIFLGDIFNHVNLGVDRFEIVPKHGPGATADGVVGNDKYHLQSWSTRMDAIFPFGEYGLPSSRFYQEIEKVSFTDSGSEVPVKVTSVPKTLKTPRIIAEEPAHVQYMQQGLWRSILEGHANHPLTSRMVGFDDQDVNRHLAKVSSIDRSLATLDLSDASDRVSNVLVERLVRRYPSALDGIRATRSTRASVPGHGEITLAKYASMGSALCFPMEAFTFLVIVFVGIQRATARQLTYGEIQSLLGRVRVYGDDIIVPVEYTTSVTETLEAFGLRVNQHKSFSNGKFRESCGGDYYDGTDVTPVRFRTEWPTSPKHAQEIISLVSFRNQLYKRGLWKTVRWLDERIPRVLKNYPTVLESSPAVGRHSFLGYVSERECVRLHRPLVRGYAVRAPSPESNLDGWPALLKFFLVKGDNDEVTTSPDHLERAGRPRAVYLKRGWYQPY